MTKGSRKILFISSLFIMFLFSAPKVSAAATFQVYFNKEAIHNKFLEVYPEQTEIVNYTIEQLNKNNIPYYIYLTHVPGYPSQTKFVVTLYKQNNLVKDFYYSFDNSYYYLYFNEKMQTEYDSYSFTIPTTGVCVEKALINSYIDDYKNGNSEFKHTDKPSGFNNYIRTWLSFSPTSGSTVNVTGGFLTRNNSNQRGTNFLYSTNLKYNYVEGKTSDIIKLLDDKGNVTDDPFSLITPIKEESISFEYGNVVLNDEAKIVSYELKTKFLLFNRERYLYYYKFSDDDDFTEIKETEDKTFTYKFTKNGHFIIKIVEKETDKKISKTFNVSKIGEVYTPDMDFDEVYDENGMIIKTEELDFELEEGDEDDSFLSKVFLNIKNLFLGKFPIIEELSALIHSYKYNASSDGCHVLGLQLTYNEKDDTWGKEVVSRDYCNMIPKIHLHALGNDVSIEALDVRYFLKYKKKIWGYMRLFVGTFTILKVLDLLRRYFHK